MLRLFVQIFYLSFSFMFLASTTTHQAIALAPPHGGSLVNRFVPEDQFKKLYEQVEFKLDISSKTRNDLECIAAGIYSPLTGFMSQKDYNSVLKNMRLSNGLTWSIPITLPISKEIAQKIRKGQMIGLSYEGHPIALLKVSDIYEYEKDHEKKQVFGTLSEEHPGVKLINEQGDIYLGGEVQVRANAFEAADFAKETLYPAEARKAFADRGWKTVVAFQTRNPLHRAHEYLIKTALEGVDGAFLNPLVGQTKSDDIPAEVRMKTYKKMLDIYFNPDRVILSVFPAAMRYAGPKEAILHAIARQNYGCTHMIVGRDHAGVGNFYGPIDAQNLFDTLAPGDLSISVLK